MNTNTKTHLPLHENDPNSFHEIRDSTENVTANFKHNELFNSKVGQATHPLSIQAVDCVQIIRDWFAIPIKPNSTYRNYIPTGAGVVSAASKSPHMLACAFDFKFLTDQETADNLYMQIRADFDAKGPLFQALWSAGCRGFGSYDTFVHIDTVKSELYPSFAAKRTSTYEGQLYAQWNKMSRLKFKTPSFIIPSTQEDQVINAIAAIPIEPDNIVVATGKEVAGVVAELFTAPDEDSFQDYNRQNWTKIIVLAVAVLLVVALGFGVFKMIKY